MLGQCEIHHNLRYIKMHSHQNTDGLREALGRHVLPI